jgi:hypothetical protein
LNDINKCTFVYLIEELSDTIVERNVTLLRVFLLKIVHFINLIYASDLVICYSLGNWMLHRQVSPQIITSVRQG